MSNRPTHISTPVLPPFSANRFLLQCRYDYRQRVWNLPAAQLSRTEAARVLARLQEYAGGLSAWSTTLPETLSEFASPGRGDLLTPARPPTESKRDRKLGFRAGKFRAQPAVQL